MSGLSGLVGKLDLASDLMTHECVEVFIRAARNRLKLSVPPRGASRAFGLAESCQPVNLDQVPSLWEKALHHRSGYGREKIHGRCPFLVGGPRAYACWDFGCGGKFLICRKIRQVKNLPPRKL